MKIFSKISSNEYNNRLEKILDNKPFDENVKNLLLSMLYKIENGYNDYYKVKFNAIKKDEIIEKILNIVEEQCFEIKVVTPKTESSKPLEQENIVCKIDINRGSILVYENEVDLLYALMQMNFLQEEYKHNKKNELKVLNTTYYETAIKEFIKKSISINCSEIIRDFDGWSWNNNIKTNENIEYNLIFQNIIMLNIDINKIEFYNENCEKALQEDNSFYKKMYVMILTLVSEKKENLKTNIKNRFNEVNKLLDLMQDKQEFLNKITNNKKEIIKNIKTIDETLSDKMKLKEEYEKRNLKLPNKEKIFSVSYFADILRKERKEQLEQLKSMNDFLDPSQYLKKKEKLENEMDFVKSIVENLENTSAKRKCIIDMQIEFLKSFEKQIEKNLNNIEYLENLIYKFRYYCLIPISKGKYLSDIGELQEALKKVTNDIIDNCIDKEIITNFSNSTSLCYNILKYIFTTKIIDLKEIKIKINKIKEEKYVNETQYDIAICIYDSKETENIFNEKVFNLNVLNVKTNKIIPLFLK